MKEIQAQLQLEKMPNHIECFDNSNIQGADAVAANPIVDLSNAKLPKSALLQILATCGANTTISLENADIYNDME